MQEVERVRQPTELGLAREEKRELTVQVHRAMVHVVQQNIDCLRRQLDQLEEAVNTACGREEEFVSELLSEVEKRLGAKIHIEKRFSAGRFKVRFLRPNGKDSSLIFDVDKWAGFRLDRWIWDSAVPWIFKRWPEFLADMDRGQRMLENVKEGGRVRAEKYDERTFRWKDKIDELRKEGHSTANACRIIGDREGQKPETIRKTVSRYF